jgi:hypothetical protein
MTGIQTAYQQLVVDKKWQSIQGGWKTKLNRPISRGYCGCHGVIPLCAVVLYLLICILAEKRTSPSFALYHPTLSILPLLAF